LSAPPHSSSSTDADPAGSGSPINEGLTRHGVASLVGVSLPTLTWVLYGPKRDSFYASWQIAKRNGRGVREIRAPRSTLYWIQRRLHEVLQAQYEPRKPTNGFVLRRSVVSNATPHVGRRWVLNVDLKDFFPSIHFGRVRGLFLRPPFNCQPSVAVLLAQICCYERVLPIGAPTSPVISNMICLRLDRELQGLARRRGCWYTRYADDLTFSTDRATFSSGLVASVDGDDVLLGSELLEVLEGNGFEPNPDKTRLRSRHERQSVTGVIVNERLSVDRRDIRRIRAIARHERILRPAAVELAAERLRMWNQEAPGEPSALLAVYLREARRRDEESASRYEEALARLATLKSERRGAVESVWRRAGVSRRRLWTLRDPVLRKAVIDAIDEEAGGV
jgi:RNA-directed DNA polymerase